MLPFTSHYYATFGFARLLQQRGYNIAFTGQSHNRYIVENEGFAFYELEYTISYTIKTFKSFFGLFLNSLLKANDTSTRYRSWYNSLLSYRNLLKKINPKLVFLDDHLGHYHLYSLPKKIPVMIVNTKLSTVRRSNIPPLNSNYIPTYSFISKITCWLLWEVHLLTRKWKDLIIEIAFLGKSEFYFHRRLFYKFRNDSFTYLSDDNCFYKGLKNTPVVMLAPFSLEFKQFKLNLNEIFINPSLYRQELLYQSDFYLCVKNDLLQRKKMNRISVIYAAFGTLMAENEKVIKSFLPKLIGAVNENKNWFLILSAPNGFLDDNLYLLDNIKIFPFVPQLDILTWCDAVVSHGGLTTIKECLQHGRPMLIYPINKRMDMRGNGARVTSNNWGLMGEMEKDSLAQITEKIQNVLEQKYVSQGPDYILSSEFIEILSNRHL